MPCLEPDKNLSEAAKKVLKALSELKEATKAELAEKTGLDTPVIARKLRELKEKGAAAEADGKFKITEDGIEAAKKI